MKLYHRFAKQIWLALGAIAVGTVILPYLILGENSYVQIHDQLDGEVLNYIYRAKYLFKGDGIPEFMNGMSKVAMVPPAPLGVLLYAILPPFAAFVLMQWISMLTGFLGMRALSRYIGCGEEVASVVAILFALIPFYPTYGITALGQPLLIYCYLRIIKEDRAIWPLCGIVYYGLFSSLTLTGFAWLGLGVVITLFLVVVCWKNRDKEGKCTKTILWREALRPVWRSALAWLALAVAYLATNLELLRSVFGKGFVTHRQEMQLHASGFLGKVWELLLRGGAYHPIYSTVIIAFALVMGVLVLVGHRKAGRLLSEGGVKDLIRHEKILLFAILVCIVFSALWTCGFVVELRRALGGVLSYFQADRVSWILPMLWMLLFACFGELAIRLIKADKGWLRGMMCLLGVTAVLLEGALILRDSTLNKNLRLIFLPDYEQITWKSFYMEDVFEEIDEWIGDEKEHVSVVSLGVYPSVALYNGYFCADGYSNNYDLEYKHLFRKIMAKELEEQEDVKAYFDDWGNRLYLVSSSYGFNGMIEKGSGHIFEDLDYDVSAMRTLNIEYVLSAAPIGNAEQLGLELVRNTPFASDSSFYEIWLYRVGRVN